LTLSIEAPGFYRHLYFETTAGRAVFSVSSITFCGSLSHNTYQSNISRMLENVLRRFLTK